MKIKMMKTKFLFTLLFVSFTLFVGCSDNDAEDPIITDPLHGTWNLVNDTGGDFGTVSTDYNYGELLWIFDTEAMTITTIDVLNPDSGCLICNTTFPYIITETNQGNSAINYAYEDDNGELQIFRLIGEITTLTDTTLVLHDNITIGGSLRTFIK